MSMEMSENPARPEAETSQERSAEASTAAGPQASPEELGSLSSPVTEVHPSLPDYPGYAADPQPIGEGANAVIFHLRPLDLSSGQPDLACKVMSPTQSGPGEELNE